MWLLISLLFVSSGAVIGLVSRVSFFVLIAYQGTGGSSCHSFAQLVLVDVGQFPFACEIHDFVTQTALCSCSLISRSWVLTAARCVRTINEGLSNTDRPVQVLQILMGSNVLSQSPLLNPVKRIQIHPSWSFDVDAAFRVDLAWLQFDTPVRFFSTTLLPVRLALPTDTIIVAPGDTAEVSGWGSSTDDTTPVFLDLIQTATQTLSTATQCNAVLSAQGQFPGISDSYICGSSMGSGACLTDTGAPLTKIINGQTKQIGVFSAQTTTDGTCGVNGDNLVYTRVDLYRDYIQSFIDDPLFNASLKCSFNILFVLFIYTLAILLQ